MGIPIEGKNNYTPEYNPIAWHTKYTSVKEFAGKMGLSVRYVQALCREGKISHLMQGKKKFMVDAERAVAELERLGDADVVVFSDVRSKARASRVEFKKKSSSSTRKRTDDRFVENLLKEAINASGK